MPSHKWPIEDRMYYPVIMAAVRDSPGIVPDKVCCISGTRSHAIDLTIRDMIAQGILENRPVIAIHRRGSLYLTEKGEEMVKSLP